MALSGFDEANGLFNPQGIDPLAFGRLLSTDPEKAIPFLTQAGLPPPGPQMAATGFPLPGQAPAPTSPFAGIADAAPAPEQPAVLNQQGAQSFDKGGFGGYPAPTKPTLGGFAPPTTPGFGGGFSPQNIGTPLPVTPTAVASAARPKGPGAPLDITSDAQKQGSASTAATAKTNDMVRALSGIKMPASPEIQKLKSPDPYKPSAQPAGNPVLELLKQMLGQNTGAQSAHLNQLVGKF